jgi:hypothetical protein
MQATVIRRLSLSCAARSRVGTSPITDAASTCS